MDFKCKTYACDEIITVNNVKELSEYLSVNNDYRHIFSSAYDIVMDAYCFLFSHLGKRLNDITKVSKYGVLKEMTILGGCMFILSKHIQQDLFTYNCKDIDICKKSELRINDYYDYSKEEWVKVDETIEKLELTVSELKVLDCLISGKYLSETARTISCGVSRV